MKFEFICQIKKILCQFIHSSAWTFCNSVQFQTVSRYSATLVIRSKQHLSFLGIFHFSAITGFHILRFSEQLRQLNVRLPKPNYFGSKHNSFVHFNFVTFCFEEPTATQNASQNVSDQQLFSFFSLRNSH